MLFHFENYLIFASLKYTNSLSSNFKDFKWSNVTAWFPPDITFNIMHGCDYGYHIMYIGVLKTMLVHWGLLVIVYSVMSNFLLFPLKMNKLLDFMSNYRTRSEALVSVHKLWCVIISIQITYLQPVDLIH